MYIITARRITSGEIAARITDFINNIDPTQTFGLDGIRLRNAQSFNLRYIREIRLNRLIQPSGLFSMNEFAGSPSGIIYEIGTGYIRAIKREHPRV